jgi:hypothetical protein
MRMRHCAVLATLVLAAAFSPRSFADTFAFNAILTSSQEVPPTGSPATGAATVTVTGDLLSITESFTGLTAPATAAHIHCCAPPGTSAPVVLPFPAFPAATSGTFTQTFNLLTALSGITEANFLNNLNSGLTYVNIHDVNFPPGEIRGQLIPATPEPESLLLLGTAALGLVAALRRRVSAE